MKPMRSSSRLVRLLWLPIDLIRFVVMGSRITLWHVGIVFRSSLLRSTSFRAFCHPRRVNTQSDHVEVCPFVSRFANPAIFVPLCCYCHPGRDHLKGLYICRRRGGGPHSSVLHGALAMIPLVLGFALLWCVVRPIPELVRRADALLRDTTSSPPAPIPERKARTEEPAAPPTEVGDTSPQSASAARRQVAFSTAPRLAEPGASIPPPPISPTPRERRTDPADEPQTLPFDLMVLAANAAKSGDYADTLKAAQDFIKASPKHVPALLLLARSALECRQSTQAETAALQVLGLNSKVAEAWAILGRVHADQGGVERAKHEYHQALELDPDCELAKAGLSRLPRTAAP